MTSQISLNGRRVVLGAKDANTPLRTEGRNPKATTLPDTVRRVVSEAIQSLYLPMPPSAKESDPLSQTRVSSSKRRAELDDSFPERSYQRQRVAGPLADSERELAHIEFGEDHNGKAGLVIEKVVQSDGGRVRVDRRDVPLASETGIRSAQGSPQSRPSPASSNSSIPEIYFSRHSQNSQEDLYASQETVFTVPDLAVGPANQASSIASSRPNPSQLSRLEVRQKVQAMKLRLSLASYKVRTNQINTPMSRLQIRPTSPKLPSLARLRAVSTAPQRTPLPTAPTVPNIRLQRPSSKSEEPTTNIPSSPPYYHNYPAFLQGEVDETTREVASTSILPRQREDLRNPPRLDGANWKDGGDLTSSVVQGRAADGLLRLMQQGQ